MPDLSIYLLGQVEFATMLTLQRRLVREAADDPQTPIRVLVGEHAPAITLGRLGSRGHVHLSARALESERLELHWISRGGPAVLHQPGQLFVYPIVSLTACRWTVGEYLARLQQAVLGTIKTVGIAGEERPGQWGVWGRTGQLATLGISVRDWVTWHGAYINVDPPLKLYRAVETDLTSDPLSGAGLSSLAAERHSRVKMSAVRAALPDQLSAALGSGEYHIQSGHPWLPRAMRSSHEAAP